MSFNSKYSGQQVENLLDQVASGNAGGGGGGITTEIDPIFSASPAAKITDENITSWNNKVDKVSGKQLSTEDFTTLLKQKLEGLSNYDDTEIQEAVSKLRTDLDALVSGDTTTAIKTFNEVIAFLDGIQDTQDLSSIIASIEQQIAVKGTVKSIKVNGTTKTPDTSGMVDLGIIEGGGSNTYIFDWDGSSTSGSLTEEMFNKAMSAESIIVREVKDEKVEFREAEYISKVEQFYCGFTIHYITSSTGIRNVSFIFQSTIWMAIVSDINIPTKTSELTNNSKFVTSNNLKTINGESILGSGNIVIEGGSSSGGSGAYAEVNHGTGDTTFTLTPNTFHVWDEVASLDLSFAGEQAGVANEYLFQFTSGATATTLTLPDVKWANDSDPTISENKIYQISVLKGLASMLEFSNAAALIENHGTYTAGTMASGATLTFEYPVASDLTINLQYADTAVIPKGQSSITIDWIEPSAPTIKSIIPSQDNTYIYII